MGLVDILADTFKLETVDVSERFSIVEVSFSMPVSDYHTSYTELLELVQFVPERDSIKIRFLDSNEENLSISNKKTVNESIYVEYLDSLYPYDILNISVTIEKSTSNNFYSIYSFERFAEDINELQLVDVLKAFSFILRGTDYIYFDLIGQELFFKTKTMIFAPARMNVRYDNIDRTQRLQSCRDASYFYNMSEFPLLPDDFHLDVDFENNPLSSIFARIETMLSLVYVSTSSTIIEGQIKVQISGQRNVDFCYDINNIMPNPELYKIFNWIFTEGNTIDKAIIARNILSLHCKFSSLVDLDEKTLSSIQSNFKLYLRDNVKQYLDLKGKVAEFICDIVSKTGDYATLLLGKFKSNLIAIFGFIFTIILANIVSDQPLNNIFTKDITAIVECVLVGSVVYLIICVIEAAYKVKKIQNSYTSLKENYKSVLSDIDMDEIFKNDELLNKMLGSIKCGIIIYTILWCVFLLVSFIVVEQLSDFPIIIKLFALKS